MDNIESKRDTELQSSGQLYARLRKKGLRPTSARIWVLQVLQANHTASYQAEQIFRELSVLGISISLGTIYRVLQGLEHAGLVLRERQAPDPGGKSRYTVASTVQPPQDYTVSCRGCGRMMALEDRAFSELLHRHARAGAFDLGLASMTLQVTCNACIAGEA